MMRVRDWMNNVSWGEVKIAGKARGCSDLELLRMRDVYEEVHALSNVNVGSLGSKEGIEVTMDVDAYYEMGMEDMHVYGRTEEVNEVGETEDIDLSFYDWVEWLDFEINELLNYVMDRGAILFHVLKEMKTWGISRDGVMDSIGLGSDRKVIGEKIGIAQGSKQTEDKIIYLMEVEERQGVL